MSKRSTLPAGGGSSMPPSNQVKKIQKGQQKRPQPPTSAVHVPPAKLPKTGT